MTALKPGAAAGLRATLGLAAACRMVSVWQITGTDLDGYFSEGHGVSTFAREGGTVYHCYCSYARGTEFLMGYYAILDRAPKGRDEGDQPMSWLRRHDEYHNQWS